MCIRDSVQVRALYAQEQTFSPLVSGLVFASGHPKMWRSRVFWENRYVVEDGGMQAANYVIRFDEVQTPVSLVQSRGRARQENSSFKVMKVRCHGRRAFALASSFS